MKPPRPLLAALVGSSLMLSGCGGKPATVSGRVTVGGEAYAGLRVSFIPEAGGATVTGKTDADGRYSLRTGGQRGLAPGEYRVTVSGYSATPSPSMTKEQVDALRVVPEQSSSREKTPHRATVAAGGNELDWEL